MLNQNEVCYLEIQLKTYSSERMNIRGQNRSNSGITRQFSRQILNDKENFQNIVINLALDEARSFSRTIGYPLQRVSVNENLKVWFQDGLDAEPLGIIPVFVWDQTRQIEYIVWVRSSSKWFAELGLELGALEKIITN